MPCIGSTTIPASRRSSPQTCSRSSASWRPSTQIRLALAVRARLGPAATEPLFVCDAADGAAFGRASVTGLPSIRNPPGLRRNRRVALCLSRNVTASAVHVTTSPQNPEARSSTTRPLVAATVGVDGARRSRSKSSRMSGGPVIDLLLRQRSGAPVCPSPNDLVGSLTCSRIDRRIPGQLVNSSPRPGPGGSARRANQPSAPRTCSTSSPSLRR